MGIKVLIADDDDVFREIVADYLKNEGLEVIEVSDGEKALEFFYENKDIRLVILDVMMPVCSGWEALAEIRKLSEVPVIMLTALGDDQNEIKGLKKGADDYISKPIKYEIFIARVDALLRKVRKELEADIETGGIVINRSCHRVFAGGGDIELSTREYNLLLYLVSHPNAVLTREQILDSAWGYDFYGDRRTVDTHIKLLRSKLGSYGDCIRTIRGTGYMFEVI